MNRMASPHIDDFHDWTNLNFMFAAAVLSPRLRQVTCRAPQIINFVVLSLFRLAVARDMTVVGCKS